VRHTKRKCISGAWTLPHAALFGASPRLADPQLQRVDGKFLAACAKHSRRWLSLKGEATSACACRRRRGESGASPQPKTRPTAQTSSSVGRSPSCRSNAALRRCAAQHRELRVQEGGAAHDAWLFCCCAGPVPATPAEPPPGWRRRRPSEERCGPGLESAHAELRTQTLQHGTRLRAATAPRPRGDGVEGGTVRFGLWRERGGPGAASRARRGERKPGQSNLTADE
jgi:hypothetical protein